MLFPLNRRSLFTMWLLLPAVLLVLLPAVLRGAADAHGERVLLVPAAEACCVITDVIVVSANAAVIAMTAPTTNVILFIFSQIGSKYKKKFFRNFRKSKTAIMGRRVVIRAPT
jgi:hypothetical protein